MKQYQFAFLMAAANSVLTLVMKTPMGINMALIASAFWSILGLWDIIRDFRDFRRKTEAFDSFHAKAMEILAMLPTASTAEQAKILDAVKDGADMMLEAFDKT